MPTEGTLTLHIRDKQVGEAGIMTQPGKFGLGGGGLVVGRSGAEPVTDDYVGEAPWPFVGGTVKRVVIDVSGESFTDLAGGSTGRVRPPVNGLAATARPHAVQLGPAPAATSHRRGGGPADECAAVPAERLSFPPPMR